MTDTGECRRVAQAHDRRFQILALDVVLPAEAAAFYAEIIAAMKDHVLARRVGGAQPGRAAIAALLSVFEC